jgi:SulP family sulfate permease
MLDSTAAATIEGFVQRAARRGAIIYVVGARSTVRRMLLTHGVRPPQVRFRSKLEAAVASARARLHAGSTPDPLASPRPA